MFIFPSGSEGVRMTISGGGVWGIEPKKNSGYIAGISGLSR